MVGNGGNTKLLKELNHILMITVYRINIYFCTQSVLKPHNKSPKVRINAGFPSSIFLFEFANKILSLYTFV